MKINQSDIINDIHTLFVGKKSRLEIKNMIESSFEYITEKVIENNRVEIRKLGSFILKFHNVQSMYNPASRTIEKCKPYKVLFFKPSKLISNNLNKI